MTNAAGEPVIGAMDFGMVGYISPSTKQDLMRLFIVAVQLDGESIVEQLIRMSAASQRVDRAGLERDLERLLRRYYGRPLKDIHALELVEEIMPIAFRYQLQLPSDLWLLGKTLAMMEGVGLKLDPDFDIFKVAKPFTQRLMRQRIDPRLWGRNLLKGAEDWTELLLHAPARASQLMEQVTAGELDIGLHFRDRDPILNRLDRLGNRLAISILIAALIVAMALLAVSQTNSWLAQAGFVVAALLGFWLLVSIWRSGRV
jgi:ubiquinone biosynthesis protein